MLRTTMFLALVAVILGSPAADAYTLRTTDAGKTLHWGVPVVSFRVDRAFANIGAPDVVRRTVSEALAGWGGLPDSPFFFQGDADPVGHGDADPLDGISDIVFVEHDWPQDPAFAGVTVVTYDVSSGEITDADVLLNGAGLDFAVDADPSCYDVGNVLTHELGHLLGLGHSEDTDATMFAVSRPGETTKRSLSDDDVAAFEELYGAAAAGMNDTSAPEVMPTCSAAPQGRAGSADLLGVVMFMVGLTGLGRRRVARAVLRRAVAAVMGLLVLAAGTAPGRASVGRTMPAEELARRADVVFRGAVLSRAARWAGRFIVTDVTLSVDECWAGRCGARPRVVTELGGEVGDVGMLAPEPSALPVGADVVVFAREVRGTLLLVGGAQAVYRVDLASDTVSRDLTSLTDRTRPEPIERMDLRTLRDVVTTRPARPTRP